MDVASRTPKGFEVEHVTKRPWQFNKEHASHLKFIEDFDDAAHCKW